MNRLVDYEWHKARWVREHPNATPKEYQDFIPLAVSEIESLRPGFVALLVMFSRVTAGNGGLNKQRRI
jgi:hypothetical protein